MFDDFIASKRPEEAARLTTQLEQRRPVLASEGMEAVQALLAGRAEHYRGDRDHDGVGWLGTDTLARCRRHRVNKQGLDSP
jgi:hypothetical protein